METTKNYNQFKLLTYNRPISSKHVNAIIEANKKENKFYLFPIIVDEKFNIIDGQHRFTACKELGVDVHYVVAKEKATPVLIMNINSLSKVHKLADRISIAIASKDAEVIKAIDIWKKTPEISMTCTVEMLYTLSSNGQTGIAIANGKYKVRYEKEWNKILKELEKLKTSLKYNYEFIRAAVRLYRVHGEKAFEYIHAWDKKCKDKTGKKNASHYNFEILEYGAK